jgi:hypothetical protein
MKQLMQQMKDLVNVAVVRNAAIKNKMRKMS